MFKHFTDRARKLVALANDEAQRLNQESHGPEHILLGLVKEGSGVAVNALRSLEVDLGKLRLAVENLAARREDSTILGKLPQTPGARELIEYANEEARKLDHRYIGTEHLLLGLLRGQDDIATQVLTQMGVNLDNARAEVLKLLNASAPGLVRIVFRWPRLPRLLRKLILILSGRRR